MTVATIRQIVRYPVKSMRGELLPATDLTFQGLPGDRRYAFVQAQSRGPFPWLTARELPQLLLYAPFHEEGAGRPRVLVTTPEGETLAADDEALRRGLEDRCGRPLFLLRDHRGNYDVASVSLISFATTDRIAEESGTPFSPARFRANFYIEAADGAPFVEQQWVGRVLRLGETARLAVTEPDERCAIITYDPENATAQTDVLAAVARGHANRAGVYAVVLTPGPVREGDPVRIE